MCVNPVVSVLGVIHYFWLLRSFHFLFHIDPCTLWLGDGCVCVCVCVCDIYMLVCVHMYSVCVCVHMHMEARD